MEVHDQLHHGGFCMAFVSPSDARAFGYDVATGLPTLAFLIFLGWHASASIQKLQRAPSPIMSTYYGILWGVSLLNLLRCLTQIGSLSGQHAVLWNVMWLVNRWGMVMLETSVIVFLLQGYLTSGTQMQALVRTLSASGSIALLDTLVKCLLIFVLHVPLFLYAGARGEKGESEADSDMRRDKWGFWLGHASVFAALYAGVLALPLMRRRDFLPRVAHVGRVSFCTYVKILLALNLVAALGALLIMCRLAGGYCVYAWSTWLYWAFYPPLLYATFLADFFADDGLDLDQMYYEEMRGAGFFGEEEEADGVVY